MMYLVITKLPTSAPAQNLVVANDTSDALRQAKERIEKALLEIPQGAEFAAIRIEDDAWYVHDTWEPQQGDIVWAKGTLGVYEQAYYVGYNHTNEKHQVTSTRFADGVLDTDRLYHTEEVFKDKPET